MSATRLSAAVALGLLLAAPAAPAHAQFGKLIKRAASAATEAAAGRAGEAAVGRATGAAPGGAGGGAGRGDNAQLEITAERLDQFAAAMRGPAEAARQRTASEAARKAWEAAREGYRAKESAYEQCKRDATEDRTPSMTPAALERMQQTMTRYQALNERVNAAHAAGDERRAAALADSSDAALADLGEVQFPGLTRKCGRPPVKPRGERPGEPTPDLKSPAFRPAVPAGMTPAQFGLLRERVAAWLIGTDRRYGFSDPERQALESRRAALAPLTEYFRNSTLVWWNRYAGLEAES